MSLEGILAAYRCGEKPEDIAESYLRHRGDVDAYLQQAESEAGGIRRQIEAAFPG